MMLEIKITGSNAEEVKKDLMELTSVLLADGSNVAPKEAKKQSKKEEKTGKVAATAKEQEEAANKELEADQKADEGDTDTTDKGNTPSQEGTADKGSEAETTGEGEGDNEEPKYTLEEVRSKAAALQRAGSRELVKSVITAAGASKLTEVDPSKYNWMMECFAAGCVIEEVK